MASPPAAAVANTPPALIQHVQDSARKDYERLTAAYLRTHGRPFDAATCR